MARYEEKEGGKQKILDTILMFASDEQIILMMNLKKNL